MKHAFLSMILVGLLIHPINSLGGVTLASGAGYRSVVDPLAVKFEQLTGIKVERIYGNMARVTAQAKTVGTVDLVLGDKSFLLHAALPVISTTSLGRGRLAAVYPKGQGIKSAQDFLNADMTRIALPEPSKAIYGRAAMQYLHNTGLYEQLEPKLVVVSTVPQAASYVLSGEVDAALINITHAIRIAEKIGGYYELEASQYSPIEIIIARMDNSSANEDCSKFLRFIPTVEAKSILSGHGLAPE